MKKSLLQHLNEYDKKPFHMPGHKRRAFCDALPYDIDITEVEGYDNLHDMQGILKDVADKARCLYGSLASFPLVNGSTCGVLAGIYSLTRENKNILIARNCHKSVYNAVEILGLNPTYIMPEMCDFGITGKVTAQSVESALKSGNIGTVVITSPTYEGVVSDLKAIYKVCKENGAKLFVDCAHGAHFGLSNFPESPVSHCDICVMSLHKTLPSLTQTALLHLCSDSADTDTVRHALSIFETSSPSYVLLASIDECLRYVAENKKDFDLFSSSLASFYQQCAALENIRVFHFDDVSKIIIAANGTDLAKKLRQQKIEVEMVSENYCLAMATVADTQEDLNTLLRALYKIDKAVKPTDNAPYTFPHILKKADSAGIGEFLDVSQCENKVSKEYIWAYPPGAPIVAPDEIIDKEIIEYLQSKKDLKSTMGKYPKIYVKKGLLR